MKIPNDLVERSGNKCELCGSKSELTVYVVPPKKGNNLADMVLTCEICLAQIQKEMPMNSNHWRCLNESAWSDIAAVKVLSWRLLHRISGETWPQDLLENMYLEDENLAWAKALDDVENLDTPLVHKDANGAILQNGDSVVLTKELDVKGATFSAKRGTAVRNIRLVHDNAEQIEGKIEGQSIVILTKYVKK